VCERSNIPNKSKLAQDPKRIMVYGFLGLKNYARAPKIDIVDNVLISEKKA
jgi:hypothetical protein